MTSTPFPSWDARRFKFKQTKKRCLSREITGILRVLVVFGGTKAPRRPFWKQMARDLFFCLGGGVLFFGGLKGNPKDNHHVLGSPKTKRTQAVFASNPVRPFVWDEDQPLGTTPTRPRSRFQHLGAGTNRLQMHMNHILVMDDMLHHLRHSGMMIYL